jgi:mxaA protein
MKNTIIKSIVLCSFLTFTTLVFAQSTMKILGTINPSINSGIQIGDVLNRTVEVEVDADLELPKTALPIKGERRDEIELTDITVKSDTRGERKVLTIALSYQVFGTADKPVLMQLPAEQLELTGGEEEISINIQAWKFWYAPLVPEGVEKAKLHLLPQSKPTLLELEKHQTNLWIFISLLTVGALGLIYVNANKAWLPFMNGAFAKAYRKIKKLQADEAGYEQAFIAMHQAFNQTYGANLFANDLPQFFVAKAQFLKMESDIARFFNESNTSLFGAQATQDYYYLKELKVLCKRLRDCERGV